MVSRPAVAYGLLVSVAKGCHIYVIHRAVVLEGSIIPISTTIADTTIAEAVVDTAIEADSGSPVTVIPGVAIVAITPVTRSP
jgi:hypothetical protein